MYLTIEETADYLSLEPPVVRALVLQGRIRAIFDGEKYLINQEQFHTYFEQMEAYKKKVEEYLSEPIPEDPDVHDED
ncbi:excisionase family DNA-binding protein [Virgibacillus sp. 179-BFC.A HS]|uniref:Excisionase family DNA-binding protein n=1 Tax=Tigheibacillus jepli TaxID=3035914 RepID=A0ABU5CKG0_9BACI|nr:excisionase family DNA-binding protein [Virgibacillus sp. 179-BFC.A HS]MDY0406833.1 excisionase family DNA-binding protein [Virgibacillus sp. 179-BFC.A HS]